MDNDVDENAILAVAHLYHSWITGLVLSLITRKSPEVASQFVYRLFRRQHLEKFLPGLKKLGLDQQPHAIAAAKYHYFPTSLAGLRSNTSKKASVKHGSVIRRRDGCGQERRYARSLA